MTAGAITQHLDRGPSFRSCEELLVSRTGPSVPLGDNEVHVWGWILDGSQACVQICASWLDADERTRAARFARDEDRRRFVLAHGCLKALLSRYIGCPVEYVPIGRNQFGKPVLSSRPASLESVEFNLSHSQDRMIIGVAKTKDLGIDLESIRLDTDVLGLAGRFYSRGEQEVLKRLPPADQREAFFHYWVAKEAVLKGQGTGISSLQSCEIAWDSSRPRASASLLGEGDDKPGWTVEWLACGTMWAAAVACRGDNWTARCMGF